MTVRLGPYAFEDVEYDAEFDVLYLRAGSAEPVVGQETPEGHVICFAEADEDRLVGFDLFDPRRTLERGAKVEVTLPGGERVAAEGIEPAVTLPQRT